MASIAAEDDLLAQKRGGRQVLNGELPAALRVSGDHVATLGENLKALIFPLAELPEMARDARGLPQACRPTDKQGGLQGVTVFDAEQGPEWGRTVEGGAATGLTGRTGWRTGRGRPDGTAGNLRMASIR